MNGNLGIRQGSRGTRASPIAVFLCHMTNLENEAGLRRTYPCRRDLGS